MGEVEIEWSRIVTLLTQLLDPKYEFSLVNVCNDPERYVKQKLAKQPLRVPIDLLLSQKSIHLIDLQSLPDLPQLY
jgi:hypothetical protein